MTLKLLTTAVLAASLSSVAAAQSFSASATCKLTNTRANKALYEGPCTVTESRGSGNNTVFSVKMGNAEPYLFAGVRGQSNWMHGAEDVKFTDLPKGGIFRWSDFVLAVAE
jgi:hypothetical protein